MTKVQLVRRQSGSANQKPVYFTNEEAPQRSYPFLGFGFGVSWAEILDLEVGVETVCGGVIW